MNEIHVIESSVRPAVYLELNPQREFFSTHPILELSPLSEELEVKVRLLTLGAFAFQGDQSFPDLHRVPAVLRGVEFSEDGDGHYGLKINAAMCLPVPFP